MLLAHSSCMLFKVPNSNLEMTATVDQRKIDIPANTKDLLILCAPRRLLMLSEVYFCIHYTT